MSKNAHALFPGLNKEVADKLLEMEELMENDIIYFIDFT